MGRATRRATRCFARFPIRRLLARPTTPCGGLARRVQRLRAKPSRFPSSVEALLSRVLKRQELPRVNRLVDLYNAISVSHVVPVGGEDLDRIEPPMRLVFARGDEPFDVREADAVEHPRPGEFAAQLEAWWPGCRVERTLLGG
jgi:hypothetical protein